MNMKYRIVLLDIDRTVLDFDKTESHSLQEIFYKYGIKLTDALYKDYKKFNHKLWADYEKGLLSREQLHDLRFKEYFKKNNIKIENPNQVEKDYLASLASHSYWLEGGKNLCKYLYGKYDLILITNGNESVQNARIKDSGLYKYIDGQVISDEIGISKPDKRLFEYLFEKYDYRLKDKEECIIIGDSFSSDIMGAYNFSIDSIWYNPNQIKIEEGDIRPSYQVHSLEEIYQIL